MLSFLNNHVSIFWSPIIKWTYHNEVVVVALDSFMASCALDGLFFSTIQKEKTIKDLEGSEK